MLQTPSRRRGAAIGLASAGAGLALLVGAISSPASADEGPEEVPGNPTCADFGFANSFKIEASGEFPDEGTYEAGDPGVETEGDAEGFVVTISYASTDPIDLAFDANTPVDAVFVKAGRGAFMYTYDPAVTSASGLESPKPSISHITFCFDEQPPPPEEPPGEEPPGEEPPGEEPPGEEPPGEEPPGEEPPGEEPSEEVPAEEAPPAVAIPGEPGFTG